MLRSVYHATEHAVRCRSSTRQQILNGSCWPQDPNLRHRTWIGCSHWTTPFRPVRAISNGSHSDQGNTLADDSEQTSLEEGEGQTADIDQDAAFVRNADAFPGIDAQSEGIIVDRVASTVSFFSLTSVRRRQPHPCTETQSAPAPFLHQEAQSALIARSQYRHTRFRPFRTIRERSRTGRTGHQQDQLFGVSHAHPDGYSDTSTTDQK